MGFGWGLWAGLMCRFWVWAGLCGQIQGVWAWLMSGFGVGGDLGGAYEWLQGVWAGLMGRSSVWGLWAWFMGRSQVCGRGLWEDSMVWEGHVDRPNGYWRGLLLLRGPTAPTSIWGAVGVPLLQA